MIQKTTFAVILVAFSLFFICFTNASPVELTPRDCGDVAYVKFDGHECDHELEEHGDCITGEIHMTEIKEDCLKVTGQFNTGFKDGCVYEYQVDGCDIEEIPSGLIYSPGTCAYEFYVKGSIHDIAGKTLKIYRDGECIAEKCIDKVE
ncbi:hypothetical protein Glove_86g215 [Diversispora epigaea]|uniref:Uncharacterized protein n=1 Tax=Diversispora epigaea TaxID=1348612 RepID=A0A397J8X1_9GLOM|nr:hypothetical protein Glove_86g214 [Diversispora epigaea]RHZ83957.1 hypothetical protein Glove_86g215 [Diversispora epigaea]